MSILRVVWPVASAGLRLIAIAALAQQQPSDPRQAEFDQLQRAFGEESKQSNPDREKLDQMNHRMAELWLAINRDKAAHLHDAWKSETDRERKKKLAEELVHAAVQSDQPDLVVEVATDGAFAQKEIKLPAQFDAVPLTPLRSFDFEQRPFFNGEPAWVVRRMTATLYEVWTPTHGWLFDQRGRLINEAHPPRHGGGGRKWYGAFLPDGRWVTTDLWEMDRTLSFFSKTGQLSKEISSLELVPRNGAEGVGEMPALIGWCRCDRGGKGFVLSIGANGGWGIAWVNWAGEHHVLPPNLTVWQLCYPRDVEPKGMYTALATADDTGKQFVHRNEPGHGSFVGFPTYSTGDLRVVIPNGETFGFWPKSHDVYIVSDRWEPIDPPPAEKRKRAAEEKTWFYKADGTFGGWIAAGRIADTDKLDGMLFRDPADHVIGVTKTYQVSSATEFQWPDRSPARPFKVFSDLKRGFFVRGKELILAAW